jgi:hypothetical protein
MANIERAKLSAFEAKLRPGTRMRWPGGNALGPTDAVELEPGDGDLLLLRHAPSRRFLGREPVHESLMIELRHPLAEAQPGPLRLGRVVYRAGTERLAYQATRAVGTLTLVAATPKRFELDAILTLVSPELDVDGAGSHQLTGKITVERD